MLNNWVKVETFQQVFFGNETKGLFFFSFFFFFFFFFVLEKKKLVQKKSALRCESMREGREILDRSHV